MLTTISSGNLRSRKLRLRQTVVSNQLIRASSTRQPCFKIRLPFSMAKHNIPDRDYITQLRKAVSEVFVLLVVAISAMKCVGA